MPLAALAVLSYVQLRKSLLLQQGEQRLAATAKGYGMALFERLLLALGPRRGFGGAQRRAARGGLARSK